MKKFLKKYFLKRVRCGSKVLGVGVLMVISVYVFVAYLMPLPDGLINREQVATTKIYDRNGVLLYEVLNPLEGKKSLVGVDGVPDYVVEATLAAEDVRFYEHGGVDLKAVGRAVYQNLSAGRVVSGASTITQQLARNMMGMEGKRGLGDKIVEMAVAVRISNEFEKEEILEMYLNTVYYGNLAYGMESAALDYFGKSVKDLDLAEAAMLAGLPQSPSFYNPFENLGQAKKRQAYVLDRMVENGFVSEGEAEAAKAERLVWRPDRVEMKAPHFVWKVLGELEDKYGREAVHFGGIEVVTSLDYGKQLMAEEVIEEQLERLVNKNVGNAALVAVDVETGEVLAWVGSAGYFDEDIDGAVDMLSSLRQPGSSIKPLTYLAAFEKGWTPATTIADVPTQFETSAGPYTPKNYDLEFHGLVRVREALANSYNVPAVKTLEFVGVSAFIGFLEKFGIDTLDRDPEFYGLALTLGGGEVRPVDMARAYLALANFGERRDLVRILEVNGESVVESEGERFLLGPRGRQHAYQVIDIMKDNRAREAEFGEGSVLELSREAAVKTGTTRNFRDNWTVGFTPELLSVVWVGNADGTPMSAISGVDGAGPIWHDFMERALSGKRKRTFVEPEGLREIEICEVSGKLPTDFCERRIFEKFVRGEEPQEEDDIFVELKINEERGMVVSDECLEVDPGIEFEEKIFAIYPKELEKWAMENGVEQVPRLRCESVYGIESPDSDLAGESGIFVRHPIDGDSFLYDETIPGGNQKIPFQVAVAGDVDWVEWIVDGKTIERVEDFPFSTMWEMEGGKHKLKVLDSQGRKSEIVEFEVVK